MHGRIVLSFFILLFLVITQVATACPSGYDAFPGSAEQEGPASHEKITELPNDTVKVKQLIALAKELRNQQTYKAGKVIDEALKLSDSLHYAFGKAQCFDVKGVIELNRANYKNALVNHFQALRLFESLNYTKGIGGSLNNIGSVYYHIANYTYAKKYYERSLEVKLNNGQTKEASSTYINIGNVYMKEGKMQECIAQYILALNNARANQDDNNLSIALMNIGEAYADIKNYKEGEKYYKQALQFNLNRHDDYHLSNCYYALGKIYTKTNRLSIAEAYFDNAERIAERSELKSLLLNIYRYKSILYEHEQRFGPSLEIYKKYHALNDSIFNEKNAKAINELQAEFETEKKDEQIRLLNADKLLAEASSTRERLIRDSLILAFVMVLIICTVLLRNMFLKQKVNNILKDKNQEIENQKVEIEQANLVLAEYNKELMKENISAKYEILKSKINPHFLFNSLTVLSNLIIKDHHEALNFVSKFSKLYRKILELENNQLIPVQQELDFVSEYLYLQKMRFKENLIFSFHIHKIHLAKNIPPFAMQLLIENAIKHNIISNENKLIVKIYSENNFIVVANNLQKKEDNEASTGIGQKNIIDRYKLVTSIPPAFTEDEERYIAYLPII